MTQDSVLSLSQSSSLEFITIGIIHLFTVISAFASVCITSVLADKFKTSETTKFANSILSACLVYAIVFSYNPSTDFFLMLQQAIVWVPASILAWPAIFGMYCLALGRRFGT